MPLPLGRILKSRPSTAVLLGLLLTAACPGCVETFRPLGHTVPGPAGAIAAAPLGGGKVAVLAGTSEAKGVFIIDELSGEVKRSFGVTKEATGLSSEAEEGPLLLSVGSEQNGRSVGAIEEWTLDGTKARIIPMPAASLGVTRTIAHVAYALIGSGTNRAAVPLGMPTLRTGTTIPLERNAHSLQQCGSGERAFLLYTNDRGSLAQFDLATGAVATGDSPGEGATCVQGGDVAYALSGSILQRSISILRFPLLAKFGSLPASRDAIALYQTDDQRIVSLNSTNRVSSIQTFPDQSAELRTASNP